MRSPRVLAAVALGACSPDVTTTQTDFSFDGTCVKCHLGMSSGHTHPNYKLRCIDCHGGDDQVAIPDDVHAVGAGSATDSGKLRDPQLLARAHVVPKPGLARFFFANGIDDDHDGTVDETIPPAQLVAGNTLADLGEVFEPGLHGEGPGEFVDAELQRDLNYTRFLNPGDLRVATVGCGAASRGAIDGGGGCHQQTVDVLRRSIMVNQPAVINGAYYGNESWRSAFIAQRATSNPAGFDPRAGAFGYALDYDGADACIDLSATHDGVGGRGQPRFAITCLEQRAQGLDGAVAAGAQGNANLPAFELAQHAIAPPSGASGFPGAAVSSPGTTIAQTGADPRQDRYPWGGTAIADASAERLQLAAVPGDVLPGTAIPDPVDVVLRTFRAYYPLNYPGSVVNQNFTFGTSILPEIARFKTNNPFGRGHSSGCSACHAQYRYDGSRDPTPVVHDDGTTEQIVDPTTKHRELDAARDDEGAIAGVDQLIGRAVGSKQQQETGRAQQKTYSADHAMTSAITSDQCGLCHGFVTRINYAYQGMAEEEQRDQLSRRAPLAFTTPAGTHVRILDSWVREEVAPGGAITVERGDAAGEALGVIAAARARDAMLAAQGFVPGNGGCAQNVFTEDCNNDGELEHALVLTHTDADGTTASVTIDEDGNGNGTLDLIDRVPRERSVDGRQVRYIYGGRNGSTRLMDVHFERGMQCIDCHFLQDVHGDGHVYSTNWDHIEIECEDCHGATARATLVTSGPNGGNDLTRAHDASGVPYFQVSNGQVVQRSRVTPGLRWVVPQTIDRATGLAREAHSGDHVAAPGQGSTFAGKQGATALVRAKLECATCHSSWIHNCLGCHIDLNLGDAQRLTVDASGQLTRSAGENEVWLSNANNPAHVNFQLLGLMRAPFVLGVSGSSEAGRLATFRSSMEAQVTVTDPNGNTIIDNATFTTFQSTDANSGRAQVATSAVAMNQTMPHTVRPLGEERGCETCHSLVDAQQRTRNEHELAETFGLGTGAVPYIGDWAFAAGAGGLELYEYKQERELAANSPGAVTRFPGLIASDASPTPGRVEPIFDGSSGLTAASVAHDVVLVRNFNPTPASGQVAAPTLTDLAVLAVSTPGGGDVVVADVTRRGNPASARPSVGDRTHDFILALPEAPHALAHPSPDVSDPFVYAAVGASGISVIELLGVPSATGSAAQLDGTFALASGNTATEVALAGDLLYIGTAQGTIEVMSLADPRHPTPVGTPVVIGAPIGTIVSAIAIEGFVLYAATPAGIAALALDDPEHPAPLPGAAGAMIVPDVAANELVASAGHLYVAARAAGVLDVDVRTPAQPQVLGNLAQAIAVDAVDVVLTVLPQQSWLLVLDASGDLWAIKLDNRRSPRERCFPDPPGQGCALDLAFLDPTQSGRDPSWDPMAGTFDDPSVDPSAKSVFHFARRILTVGHRLARGAMWEQIGTLTGRRLRDSFMPGAGVLSLPVMQKMRAVKLCESTSASNQPGNLGALGYADQRFAASGTCQPLGQAASNQRPAAATAAQPTRGPPATMLVLVLVFALALLVFGTSLRRRTGNAPSSGAGLRRRADPISLD